MGSVDLRASKLTAFKVGGLKKKSATRPRPHLNQAARIRSQASSNHSQSLMASYFAALSPAAPKFSALKDLNPFSTVSKVQEDGSILKIGFTFSKWPHLHRAYLVTVYNQNFIAVCNIRERVINTCNCKCTLIQKNCVWVTSSRELWIYQFFQRIRTK